MRYHPESLNKSKGLLKSSGLSKIKSTEECAVSKVEAKNSLSGIATGYLGRYKVYAIADTANNIWLYGSGSQYKWFRTSPIVSVEVDGNSFLVSTENSVYRLSY